MTDSNDQERRQYLLARYWEAALGFWRKDAGRTGWLLTIAVFTIALVNVGLAYRMNVWHRVMFDALESRDAAAVFRQSLILFPLVFATVAMGCANTFSKMTLQRGERMRAEVLAPLLPPCDCVCPVRPLATSSAFV